MWLTAASHHIAHCRKRMTAVKCMEHPWMKARKSTNLNSSTSSLDSALCMDSASSMEPSPVSSASSSFSPAPSTTTRSSSSTVSTSSSNLSQPEDMKKVNEKLISTLATERLTAADSTAKMRGEGSPTSTNSSTSTLKGDESAENIPGLVQEQNTAPATCTLSSSSGLSSSRREVTTNKTDTLFKKEPLVKKDSTDSVIMSGHSHSFEGPLVVTKTYKRDTLLSDSEKSPSMYRRSKTPISSALSIDGSKDSKDYLSRSYTLDLRREKRGGTRSTDREPPTSPSTSTLGRSSRGMSRQTAEDLLALDPKTIQSLERLKKLTGHKRPKTPEPQAPAVSDVKLLHSPERRRRRKSEGMHPIEKQAGGNFVPAEKTLHEGDEGDDDRDNKEAKKETAVLKCEESNKVLSEKKETVKPIVRDVTPTPIVTVDSSKDSNKESSSATAKNEVLGSKRVTSPVDSAAKAEKVRSKAVTSPTRDSTSSGKDAVQSKRVASPTSTPSKDEVADSPRISSPMKAYQRSVSPSKSDKPSETEKKTTTTSVSSKWTSSTTTSKAENGDRSPSPKKRLSSTSSNEDTSAAVRPTNISSFTRTTPVDRMWSDFKKEDGGSTKIRTSPRSSRYQQSPNSSPSHDSPTSNRRRFVTREKFIEDSRSSFKLKPSSSTQGGGGDTSPLRSSSPAKNQPAKEETKSPPEDVNKTPPAAAKKASTTKTKSSPVISVDGDNKKSPPKTTEVKDIPKPEDAPGIIVRPPSVSEERNQKSSSKNSILSKGQQEIHVPRDLRVRQKSPVSDRMKVIKSNRRKTPVISEDALAAILSGDIPDDELVEENGLCPVSPSQMSDCRMTLETCPEEDEEAVNKQEFPSPNRKHILKTSSLEQTPSHLRSPEKKVTISSAPCIRRAKKPMLSAEMRERTKSLTSFSPERSLSPTSPSDFSTIPEEESNLSKSSNLLSLPMSRLRSSSLVMSQSTPDLSELLGPKKKDRKARRIERSNSKRRVRVDSYVTSTTPNSTYNPSSGTHTAQKSSRRLSGSRFSKFTAAFSRKDKENTQQEKDTNNRQSEKSTKSKRW